MLAALVALAPAGCTTPRSPEIPTAQAPATPPPSASAPAPVQESNYDKALRYTRCMNDNLAALHPDLVDRGARVPDPVEGTALPTGVSLPGILVRPTEVFNRCKHLMPTHWPVKRDPADIARWRPFYDCMRKRGIDIPEPDAQGMVRLPSDPDWDSTPEYEAAEETCKHLVDDPAVKAGDR